MAKPSSRPRFVVDISRTGDDEVPPELRELLKGLGRGRASYQDQARTDNNS